MNHQDQDHGLAYAGIDLAAIRYNLDVVRKQAPKSKIMAVIKANAYGHGMARVANALANADAFAVARVDEGVRLRQSGVDQRVTVLQGFSSEKELQDIAGSRLEAVIHSAYQLDLIENWQGNSSLTVWLKIDTGMNRLGFKAKEVAEVYLRLKQCPKVEYPINFITHLASADDKISRFTAQQIELFNEVTAGFDGERSIGNSAGVLAWQEAVSDWVRPGIMLYGISPFPDSTGPDFGLKPVMSLYSKLIAVKPLEQGETVGYGNSWVCRTPTLLGVVAIGYGDGYPRYAKPGTPVLVHGQRVPLIGRVSMDMMTVDLTTQPSAKPGDLVTLWGASLPIEEIARCADTIPYTLVCGVTQRVQLVEV